MNSQKIKTTVLVTGASRGLGLEFCRQYLAKEWCVVAVSRAISPALAELKASYPEALETFKVDLSEDLALAALAGALDQRVIDVLINNAGTMGRTNFADSGLQSGAFGGFDRNEWHDIFDINVCTPMRLAELLVEHVAASPNGRIVTLSSMLGSMTLNRIGGIYAYRASKAAVNAIMKSMAIDLAQKGIIAAALHPGFVRTDMSGPGADITPKESVSGMIAVLDILNQDQSGALIAWNGEVMPW